VAAEVVAGLVTEAEVGVAAGVAEGVVTGKGVPEPYVTCGNNDDAAAEALLLAVAMGADACFGTVLCVLGESAVAVKAGCAKGRAAASGTGPGPGAARRPATDDACCSLRPYCCTA